MRRKKFFIIIVSAIVLVGIVLSMIFFLLGPSRGETSTKTMMIPSPEAGFALISPDFTDGGPIPARFTCDGEDIPPTLAWGEPPAGTKSFVLIIDDPDAPSGTWTHWIIYNIPPVVRFVDDQYSPTMWVDDVQILFGKNSWGKQTYGGPCPPSGTHHYIFQLFALDIMLGSGDKATKNKLAVQMQGHIIGYAELTGTYTK